MTVEQRAAQIFAIRSAERAARGSTIFPAMSLSATIACLQMLERHPPTAPGKDQP